MNITEQDYVSLIGRLHNIVGELEQTTITDNNLVGLIGEKLVGFSICFTLWKLGYCVDFHYRPRSYFIIPHYQADPDGIRGIDYVLNITNTNEERFKIYIEVKNWNHYPITQTIFNTEILQRFEDADRTHQGNWIITMNTRNIPDITNRCEESNIHILPLTYYVTLENIGRNNIIRNVYGNFIDTFDELIRRLVPETAYPDMDERIQNTTSTEGVMTDILMGVSYGIIQERYDVSRNYIYRLASYIRGFIPFLPDRRNQDWREQWEIQG